MSRSVPGSSGTYLAKRPHLECGNETHSSGKKFTGGSVSTNSAVTRRKGSCGVSAPDVLDSSASSASPSSTSAAFQVGMLFKFLINGEASHPTGLWLIWFGVTIFSLSLILPCSITFINLMSRQLQLIIPLFRRLMSFLLREWLNPLLVVLVSILACLWFLSVLGASDPYLTWSILIVICIYLLLRCLLLDMYSSLSSIQDAYLHIPIVKHHHHILCFVWHNVPYQWKVLPFGLATAPRVFMVLTKPFFSFAITKVSILLSIWKMSWS